MSGIQIVFISMFAGLAWGQISSEFHRKYTVYPTPLPAVAAAKDCYKRNQNMTVIYGGRERQMVEQLMQKANVTSIWTAMATADNGTSVRAVNLNEFRPGFRPILCQGMTYIRIHRKNMDFISSQTHSAGCNELKNYVCVKY